MRRWLWVMAVGVRLMAAALLLFGPWTDDPAELEGWDATRFQQISDAVGTPWVDYPVEYPPGTVVLIEVLARSNEVGTNRTLIASSLVVDLATAIVLERTLRRRLGPDVGLVYLLLGTALVPAGLLRFDLWSSAGVALGLILLVKRPRLAVDLGFGLAVAVGAAIKVAPVLLVAAALATRRWRAAAAATAIGTLFGAAWIVVGGFDAIGQVLSLRSVTGWHLESVPGSLIALATSEQPRLEADAFRIGTINPSLTLVGRVITVIVTLMLLLVGQRRRSTPETAASVTLGATACLLVTAPLLSPQFLLWLTPPAAMLWSTPARKLTWLTGAAVALTALTLALFGPPDLDHPIAASLLLIRDALVIALVVAVGRELLRNGTGDSTPASTGDQRRIPSG